MNIIPFQDLGVNIILKTLKLLQVPYTFHNLVRQLEHKKVEWTKQGFYKKQHF